MPELSFNQRQALVQAAIQKARGVNQLYVVELYEDRAVYEEYGDDSEPGTSWQVPYSIADDETVTLGERVEVEREVTYRAVKAAVKFAEGSDNIIEGFGVPFGPDIDGESFGPDTDLCLDWFPNGGRPILYHHGFDPSIKTAIIGRELSSEAMPEGIWVRAELDKANRYYNRVKKLIDEGAVGWSNGGVDHLVEATKTGHITRWPVAEYSLTPLPAFPNRASFAVKATDLIDHLTEAGTEVPAQVKALIRNDDGSEFEPYSEHGERVLADVQDFVDRTRSRREARAKSKRDLSGADRSRLTTIKATLVEIDGDLDELLRDPEAQAHSEAEHEFLAFQRAEAVRNGVPV